MPGDKIYPMKNLPTDTGSYALFLHLPVRQIQSIGKLGTGVFKAGNYVYFGSARGPGGLKARLSRHIDGKGKNHWHIDFLRSISAVTGFIYVEDQYLPFQYPPVECLWAQAMLETPSIQLPMANFGASDCKSGCAAHLIYHPISKNTLFENCRKIFAKAIGIDASKLVVRKFDYGECVAVGVRT